MPVENLGQVQALSIGTSPPENTKMAWYDDNVGIKVLKYFDVNLQAWVPFATGGVIQNIENTLLYARVIALDPLPGDSVYDNGTGGVGATYSGGGDLGVIDGIDDLEIDDFICLAGEENSIYNGLYRIQDLDPFILIRDTSYDSTGEVYPSVIFIEEGTKENLYYQQKTASPVIGTSEIIFEQIPIPEISSSNKLIYVDASTTIALPANTYDNGTDGVGATITANAVGAFPAPDGVSIFTNMKVLVNHEVNQIKAGVYRLNKKGGAGQNFQLKRLIGADSSSKLFPFNVLVLGGSTYSHKQFTQNTKAPVLGTSNIVFERIDNEGGTNLSKVLYVDPNGNDSTAIKGSLNFPYLTIEAAEDAANTGDLINILPGEYTPISSLTKININYNIENATINYNGSDPYLFNFEDPSKVFITGNAIFNLGFNKALIEANDTIMTSFICKFSKIISLGESANPLFNVYSPTLSFIDIEYETIEINAGVAPTLATMISIAEASPNVYIRIKGGDIVTSPPRAAGPLAIYISTTTSNVNFDINVGKAYSVNGIFINCLAAYGQISIGKGTASVSITTTSGLLKLNGNASSLTINGYVDFTGVVDTNSIILSGGKARCYLKKNGGISITGGSHYIELQESLTSNLVSLTGGSADVKCFIDSSATSNYGFGFTVNHANSILRISGYLKQKYNGTVLTCLNGLLIVDSCEINQISGGSLSNAINVAGGKTIIKSSKISSLGVGDGLSAETISIHNGGTLILMNSSIVAIADSGSYSSVGYSTVSGILKMYGDINVNVAPQGGMTYTVGSVANFIVDTDVE